MDEMPCWNVCGNWMWRLVTKKLHIIACELHHIYDIVYNISVRYNCYNCCNLFNNTQGCINTMSYKCLLQLENLVASLVVKPYIFS